jgi:nitroreductase
VLDELPTKDRFCAQVFSGIYRPSRFAQRAPVLVVLVAKVDVLAHRIGGRLQAIPYYLMDVGIAGEHFVLQATELGIGTCWIGWFDTHAARKALDLPSNYKVVALIAMGYPTEAHPARDRERKPIEKLLFFNTFRPTSQ